MLYCCDKCQHTADTMQINLASGICPACGERYKGEFAGYTVRDFHIIGELARGANGAVYVAQQPLLRRDVALKLILQEHLDDQEHLEQFFAEARAVARVTHPNIVQALAAGVDENGICYFAMELVEGETLEKKLDEKKVVALGEIGLDYHYDFSDRETQMRFFRAQMELAAKKNIPVIIHDREAHGDTMDMIREYKNRVIGILHSCSASAEQVKEYVKMGWYISFSGVITFKNAAKTLDSVLATPKDRILVETDCPYLAPVPMRGKTNHSGYMHYTAAKAAELLQMDYEAFCLQEVQNAKTLLGIK